MASKGNGLEKGSRGQVFAHRSRVRAPAEAVDAWHAAPGAIERLTPPWEDVRVAATSGPGHLEPGSRVTLAVRQGPLRLRWVAEHTEREVGRGFTDVQRSGPFAAWKHRHIFEPDGPEACWLEDRVSWSLPFGANALVGGLVRSRLARLFRYRHHTTAHDVARHAACRGDEPMRFLVTGASGLVGSSLIPYLTAGGHSVTRLARSGGPHTWAPEQGRIDPAALQGADAVVHLAGRGIADARWTPRVKGRIRDSRVRGTKALASALAGLERPPRVLVCASAVGVYGDRGDETLTEDSAPGSGFLPDVCQEWEQATAPAREAGVRVVHLRFGVVLSPKGGMLGRILGPFRLGAGGIVGSGRQYLSWIGLDDALDVIHHAALDDGLQGPVNAVAPSPATNAELTRALGRVLGRPTLAPVPAFAARLAFGEMADALLLASTRAVPAQLLERGFRFRQPEIEPALRHALGRAQAA